MLMAGESSWEGYVGWCGVCVCVCREREQGRGGLRRCSVECVCRFKQDVLSVECALECQQEIPSSAQRFGGLEAADVVL